MTFDEMYKPDLEEYMVKWRNYFAKFQFGSIDGLDILALKKELEARRTLLQGLQSHPPGKPNIDPEGNIEEAFAALQRAHQRALQALNQKLEEDKQQLVAAHKEAVDGATAASDASISHLAELYAQLLTYRDRLRQAIIRYNIKPSDIAINLDQMSRDEMETLVAACIQSCEYITKSKTREWMKLAYEPPKTGNKDDRMNYAIAVAVIAWLGAPFILVAMFGYMFVTSRKIHKHVDNLRIADALMYGVNFDLYKDDPNLDALGEVDFTELEEKYAADLAALQEKDPAKEMEAVTTDVKNNWGKISAEVESTYRTIYGEWETRVNAAKQAVTDTEARLAELMSKLKPFGESCNLSAVMDTNYTLGKAEGIVDIKYDLGLTNIVFSQRNPEMLLFARHMFANILLSVRPKNLIIEIYDPERLGQDFATFLDDSTKAHVFVNTDDFTKLLKNAREYSAANLRILDTRSISDFNKEAEEKGMVTLDYHLYILATPDEQYYKNTVFMEYIKNSPASGVLFWMFGPTPIQNCRFYTTPWEGVQFPYPTDQALCQKVTRTYVDAYLNLKDGGIDYFKAFAEKYIPREKWWTENTDKGIKINIGLESGDPGRGYALELGDANVHGLCAGTTGAGKSVFNNQMIASLITRYPPSALELILVDFKNIEFASLTNKQTHYSRIPHARVIAGTKDGEYALSIFDYLIAEMDRRTELLNKLDVKKLEEYNQKLRSLGRARECIPRILLIIDEFQVMFTEVEPKVVDVIQDRIRSLSKLARFCGCHMLFTSQSMAGTMSQDVKDQFSLRIALRCTADTSNSLIGAPLAAYVKSKFGYCYSNTNGGQTQDSTKMWRTPFMPNEDFYDTAAREAKIAKGKLPAGSLCVLDELAQMLPTYPGEVDRHAYFYDEDERFPGSMLTQWYQDNAEAAANAQRLFLLGERTGFSLNPNPENFLFTKSDGESIMVYGFEAIDLQNLVFTFRDNIAQDPTAKLLINCADPDMFNVLELDNWYDKNFLEQAEPMQDVTPWLEMLESIIEDRKENPDGRGPLYFMPIYWTKQIGLYRNENYKMSERWKSILADAPAADVHIIFITQAYKEVPQAHLGFFNHAICAKGPDDASYKFLGNASASKLPKELGIAIYRYGSDTKKFKIYQYEFSRKAAVRSL